MELDYEEAQESKQFELLIQGLIDNNFGCCNDFIPSNIVIGLKANLESLNAIGKMVPAGYGNQVIVQKDKSTRGDKINWIDSQSTNLFELAYLNKIERFIIYLNTSCFTAIQSFESHYANYAKYDFYKRHIDQFKNEKGRQFSIVLYLNQDWNIEDGGNLSLYPKDKEQIDIAPFGGRLIFFRSSEMEHEVHASYTRDRSSIAGWLKN